jgi:serine/threonine protein kinase
MCRNLLITSNYDLKLGGFGEAIRVKSQVTLLGKEMLQELDMKEVHAHLTCYSSPEMAREEYYSCKSDVWSLGATMYELAFLKVAFEQIHAEKCPEELEELADAAAPDIVGQDEAENRSASAVAHLNVRFLLKL